MKARYHIVAAIMLTACCAFCAACGGMDAAAEKPAPAPVQEPAPSNPTPEGNVSVPETECPLEDGIYIVDVDTDSSMFHLNEASEGKGTLTVENGRMTVHISLPSKKIEFLYFGTAADAAKEGAELLKPTLDTVTYSDGETDEVYGFDIPVPYLDEEFGCAIIGTHGNWYDHKISVTDPVPKT
ncbi:MAG: hypothetical protein IKR07_02050 [Oscillospiraceae bacterium]|nr:hypothetical protein [Oscillospiraceae bacterium]